MTYYRVRLTGELCTLSELHIGRGEVVENTVSSADAKQDQTISKPSAVLLDIKGQPYIPASTLRGFLRAQLALEAADVLFGSGNKPEAEGRGMMGLVRIYDAQWQASTIELTQLPTVTRTGIDPVTQATKQHHLASHEFVPVNTRFRVELEIDQRLTALRTDSASACLGELDDTLIQALLDALTHFNAESSAQLGKGKSIGQGRLQWELKTLEAISLEQLKAWAQATAKNSKPLDGYYQSLTEQFKPSPMSDKTWTVLPLQLRAMSPLLINNPEDEALKTEALGAPKQVFLKRVGEQNVALIPGSTLKGWCRAQCRRILLTLTQNNQLNQVENLLVQLFGSTDQVGVLRFYDATVAYTEGDIHKQTFNAVDRFTGGVKEGALYSVDALYPQTAFAGQVAYQGKLPAWMKWLLLLVWRDAEEGDLIVGSGKAKGYGQLVLQGFKQGAHPYFEAKKAELKHGVDELQQQLNLASATGVGV